MNRQDVLAKVSHWHAQWLFTGLGERTRTLLHGLRWLISSAILSRVLCGLATTLSARWMGPAAFGEANLSLAATYYIQIPLFLGLHSALMHFVPQQKGPDKTAWLADGIRLSAMCALLTLSVGYVARSYLAEWHGVSVDIFQLALLWCLGYFLYSLGTVVFTAEENFRARALLEVLFTIVFPGIIVAGRFLHKIDGPYYVIALTSGYAVAGLYGLGRCWGRLSGHPMLWSRVRALLGYGLIGSVGGLSSAMIQSSSRLVANGYLSLQELGVLSAYQSGSIQMTLFFLAASIQAFFPIASRTPDKKSLFQKISRIGVMGAIPAVFLLIGTLFLYFAVLGRHYPLRTMNVLIFSIVGVLVLYQGLLSWFWASTGRPGLFFSTFISLLIGILNLLLCFEFIPGHGVSGAGLAMGLSSAAGIACFYLPWVRKSSGLG